MRLVEMQCITEVIAAKLGNEFNVSTDSKTDIDSKVPVTVQAELSQFPIEAVACETLELTITAYLNVDTEALKAEWLYKFDKLVGSHSGTITNGNSEEFRFNLYLGAHRPITDPVYDMGNDCAVYQLTGTMLLARQSDGGIFSNEITTELSNKSFSDSKKVSGELAIFSYEVDPNYNIENTISSNSSNADPRFTSKGRLWALTCLMTDRAIDKLICTDIESADGTSNYYMRRTYPSGIVINKYVKLIGGKLNGQAGAYSFYNITLQELGGGE